MIGFNFKAGENISDITKIVVYMIFLYFSEHMHLNIFNLLSYHEFKAKCKFTLRESLPCPTATMAPVLGLARYEYV